MPHLIGKKLLVTNKILSPKKLKLACLYPSVAAGMTGEPLSCAAAVFYPCYLCPVMHLSSNRLHRRYATPANSTPYFSLTHSKSNAHPSLSSSSVYKHRRDHALSFFCLCSKSLDVLVVAGHRLVNLI